MMETNGMVAALGFHPNICADGKKERKRLVVWFVTKVEAGEAGV